MKVKKLEALTFSICLFDGLINEGGGGLISGWAYIQNNIFIGKRMGLYPGGGLKPGGLKSGILRYASWKHAAET